MREKTSKIFNLFKKFEDLSAIGIANFSGTAISTIFWLYLATIISTVEYGQISYFIAIGSLGSVFSLIGGGATITVFTAKKIPIASAILFISISISIISAAAILIIIQNPIVSAYVIGYSIFGLSNAYLLGEKKFKKYSKIFILQKIIFVTLALVFNNIIGPTGVVLAVALSFFIHSHTVFKIFTSMKKDFPLLRTKMNFMMNNYGKDISRVLFSQLDKIIIAPFFGFALLGNYYLGLQFLSALSIIPVIIVQYTLTHDASGSPTYRLKKVIVGLSIIMATLGITVAPHVLPSFFPKFVDASTIVQILSIAIVPRTISMMYASKFLGTEKSKIVLIGAIVALSVQIPLLFSLGTIIGVNGIAMALVISETVLMTYYIVIHRRMR